MSVRSKQVWKGSDKCNTKVTAPESFIRPAFHCRAYIPYAPQRWYESLGFSPPPLFLESISSSPFTPSMLRELESLQSPVPNPSCCCLAGNGALLPHIPQDCTHTPQNRITFPCQLLNPASPEISDKSGCLGAPFFVFLCREGERNVCQNQQTASFSLSSSSQLHCWISMFH